MSKASLQPHIVFEPMHPSAARCDGTASGVQLTPVSPDTDQLAQLAAAIRADAGRSAAEYVQRANTEQHGE